MLSTYNTRVSRSDYVNFAELPDSSLGPWRVRACYSSTVLERDLRQPTGARGPNRRQIGVHCKIKSHKLHRGRRPADILYLAVAKMMACVVACLLLVATDTAIAQSSGDLRRVRILQGQWCHAMHSRGRLTSQHMIKQGIKQACKMR